MDERNYAPRLFWAYLIFFFLGALGMHRIYLGHVWVGAAWLLCFCTLGPALVILLPAALIYDFFAIPFLCKNV